MFQVNTGIARCTIVVSTKRIGLEGTMLKAHHGLRAALCILFAGLAAPSLGQDSGQTPPNAAGNQAIPGQEADFCTRLRNARTPAEQHAIMQRMYDIRRQPGPHGMESGMMERRARARRIEMECQGGAPGAGTRPPPVQRAGVTYLSGGIGQDDVASMRAAAPRYNLQLTFAGKAGEYIADVDTRIRQADGTIVLGVVSEGPLLFVHLPPGRYRVSATYNGVEQHLAVRVPGRGSAARSMAWRE
ncbi:hypothetical protein LBW62_01095 [Ralstonia solanacearum]|uniref:hypothetical protein n=1 Tax=Ralstonia solanacearum TaxID=305 RepID=UPI0012D3A827|nr:hypothetical protein [Ralstonia solanacearum]MBB6593113.1 hypothetical protein [Ralstonia solanacearum]MBB6597340.1 hypothetical protein [Ralstonia solanacearum]MDB0539962.1 hypothetical protein [Ralstonia solanacearum]MDB0549903.1 hypothetical protein [Ralstonia solanacearum]MDB0554796.1 hypothetical protein [Ralstonia solanacearum]